MQLRDVPLFQCHTRGNHTDPHLARATQRGVLCERYPRRRDAERGGAAERGVPVHSTTERSHSATCARMERHNFEVTHVGFGAYTEATREGRFRRKRKRERQYKQQVHVFFSFFSAGYKPNARSHNVTQEDVSLAQVGLDAARRVV